MYNTYIYFILRPHFGGFDSHFDHDVARSESFLYSYMLTLAQTSEPRLRKARFY